MTFRHGAELTTAIKQVVAAGPVDIAVAFWGSMACDLLELPSDLSGHRVACDARSGFCSPIAIKALLDRGAAVVDVRKLHAKVYWSPAAMVVASANASSGGLSRDGDAAFGLEAGTLVTDGDAIEVASDWFKVVFAAGTAIGPEHIAEIEALWRPQRANRPSRSTLTTAILTASEDLADRALRAYVYSADEPSKAHVSTYKSTPFHDPAKWDGLASYPFFWGELPPSIRPGDELLCFEVEGRTATCEGVWRVGEPIGKGAAAVWPSTVMDAPLGRQLGSTDEIERRVAAAVAAGRVDRDGEPIELAVLADAVADRHQGVGANG